jgi:hypothetical protein
MVAAVSPWFVNTSQLPQTAKFRRSEISLYIRACLNIVLYRLPIFNIMPIFQMLAFQILYSGVDISIIIRLKKKYWNIRLSVFRYQLDVRVPAVVGALPTAGVTVVVGVCPVKIYAVRLKFFSVIRL